MEGLALSAVQGIVPGIVAYVVLRGGYYLFVERTKKVEGIFVAFKDELADSLRAWNRRHSNVEDKITFSNMLDKHSALASEKMRERDCCQQESSGKDSDLSCRDLRKKIELTIGRIARSPVLEILVGTIGCIALSSLFLPPQIKSSDLVSRTLYRGVSVAGCLAAGYKQMMHLGKHIREVIKKG
ncbi:MAG: hypothetical protein IT584_03080 [Chlamydiae bacterium]|nr:hypothetical protein [Chlamydiota bacterium]